MRRFRQRARKAIAECALGSLTTENQVTVSAKMTGVAELMYSVTRSRQHAQSFWVQDVAGTIQRGHGSGQLGESGGLGRGAREPGGSHQGVEGSRRAHALARKCEGMVVRIFLSD